MHSGRQIERQQKGKNVLNCSKADLVMLVTGSEQGQVQHQPLINAKFTILSVMITVVYLYPYHIALYY